jgi:FAD/FMN-containing dehydrogenases
MQMPPLDPAILARRSEIVAALRAIVPGEGVIDDLDGMRPYECDALSAYRQMPLVVVLPETWPRSRPSCATARTTRVKVVPRGAGTSLSGGSMPVGDAILLGLGKFNRVLEIDYANRCARVQPGVTNLGISGGRA